MKSFKKIIAILMVIYTFMIPIINILGNKVEAVNLPIKKADLYSKGEVVLFRYKGMGIGVEVIVYKKDGIEYPAYCVNKGRPGVTEEHKYSVDINKYVSNNAIWKAVVNGYPFKTPEELGCKTMEEAYAATKMAVYDAMYHYDIDKFTTYRDIDSNKRVVLAIKKIITSARNSKESKVCASLKVKEEIQEWKVDEKEPLYVSKKYSVSASAPFNDYQIKLQKEDNSNIKLTNLENKEQNIFKARENFKVMIPISEMEDNGEFKIIVSADLATYPVLYGETPNPKWQNFAVTAGTYELADTIFSEKYQKNKTEIEILKQDGDNKKPLANAVFTLCDSKHNVIYQNIITNDRGKANVENVLPGTYYLKEIQTPDGYYGYDKEIKIEVKLNEKIAITVKNYEKPKEEETDKKQDENHFEVGEKKKIEKIPKTGM